MILTNRLADLILAIYALKKRRDFWNCTYTADAFARWVWDHYGFSIATIDYHRNRAELLYKNGTRCG